MFQLRDRLFAGTAHEMAHRKGPRVNFFEIRPPTERFSDRPKCSRPFRTEQKTAKWAQRAAREGKSMNSAARIGSSFPWVQRLLKEAPISASSLGRHGRRVAFLTTRATLDHHASFPSTLRQTAPIIIGTCSSPVWNQDKFTATVSREPQIPRRECDLIPPGLLDPYGRGVVVPWHYNRDSARQVGDNAATAMKSVVVDPRAYDWEGDIPLNRPWSRTIIYEMHVRGFTRHQVRVFRMRSVALTQV